MRLMKEVMRMRNKKHDPVNIVYKIAELVRELTDEDFKYFEDTIEGQESYFSPLRMGTVNRQRELAEHNKKMVNCLKQLRELVSEK